MTFAIDTFSPASSVASGSLPTAPGNRDAASDLQHAAEISALNKLVVAVLDNADEYRRAIFAVEQLLNSLQHGLYNRVQAAEQLQSHVRSLGAQPATTLSSLAAVFAARLTMRSVLAKDRYEDLLQDVARGEDTLRMQFKGQLATARLSPASREYVKQALVQFSADRNTSAEKWDPFDVVAPRTHLASVVSLRGHSVALSGDGPATPNAEDALNTNKILTDRDSCPTIPTMT